jgi:hypothetical protein
LRYNVVIPIALVLIVTLGGWAYLNQTNLASPQIEEELPPIDDEQRSSPPMGEGAKGEMGDIFQGFLPELQNLVNASAEPEELLEFVVNTTDQLEALLDETDGVFGERLASMLDFFEGLEVELQGLIDEGFSSQDLLDHVTRRMGELLEGVSGRSKQS